MKRRTMLGSLLGVLSTTVSSVSFAQVNSITSTKTTKSSSTVSTGMTPEAILNATRLNLGLQTAADITDEVSSKIRVADDLVTNLSVEQLNAIEGRIKLYASNTVMELMSTNLYELARQVDMKFVYIPAAEEVASTITALKEKSIDAKAAQLAIRSTFGRFLEGLEQIPQG